MLHKIVSRFYDRTIYECEADSLLKAVESAVKIGADLSGANLRGANLNWQSHDTIAELMLRAADDDIEKRKVAGLILVSRDWCWDCFSELSNDPLWRWAIDTLATHVIDGDNAPEILRNHAKALADITGSI